MALELRPTCEQCNKALAPNVELLHNVCPNCGGGFVPRPVRPSRQWKGSAYLGERPASKTVKHKPVELSEHGRFAAKLKGIRPEER